MIFILADKLLEEMLINVDLQCDYDDIKHIIDALEPKLYVNDDFLKSCFAKITTAQGEWIEDKVAFHLVCNQCGCTLRQLKSKVFEGDYDYNFCPNCGAKMRGKEK